MVETKNIDVNSYHPLVLAYIGDAVYEVYIRDMLIERKKISVHMLHVKSILYVKAAAQATVLHEMLDELNEDETDIVRRGRNAKSGTIPKNAKVVDYKYATAFEALIGYLHLTKQYDRLNEVMEKAVTIIDRKLSEGVENNE